ncbi:Peptidoglycan-associated lipoprotein [subsurface metagenome]
MNLKGLSFLFALGLCVQPLFSEVLRFKYAQDEQYRIVSEVHENVYINGALSHRANILNKIAVDTLAVKGGAGLLSSSFQISERTYGVHDSFVLTEDYYSAFWRDELGAYDIGPEYYMPVVRNVPLFPEGDIEVGYSWTAEGKEVHDFRRNYGITKAFRFPIQVNYTYLRNEELEGGTLAVLGIHYTVFHRVAPLSSRSRPVPIKITGVSDQVFYFDIEKGKPHSYEESFDFIFHLSNGDFVEYEGTARGTLIESPKLNRERMVEELKEELKDRGIEDASVKAEENGVTLTLENIQFPPDAALLLDPEKRKLMGISEILKRYADRDILITGHTARVGTEESSQALSEQRAKAVGDYLISLGAVRETQIMTRGMGSREPLADNATEAGRLLNRRVEITILEN